MHAESLVASQEVVDGPDRFGDDERSVGRIVESDFLPETAVDDGERTDSGIREFVTEAGIDLVTVDTADRSGVDIVGDVASKSLLREAGIEDAGAIIIGLADDSKSLLTAVVARSLNPDIEILVRVNDSDATRKALSAGADYVLAVPRVSARMLAKELRGEDVLAPASQIRLIRVPATPFAGSTIADSGIFEQSGCRIIALEDEDGLQSTVDPGRRLTGDERLTLAGPDEAVRRFQKQFDVTPVDGTPEQS